jgi:molybdopterin molybdotransferase
MTQLSDDCFAFGGALATLAEALDRFAAKIDAVTGVEAAPLSLACGLVSAQDVIAPFNVPPHPNAAVDGYAVFFDDLSPDGETRLPVTGRVPAGGFLGRAGVRGEAVRIFTGAPMPDGFDTVFMQEDCRADGDGVILPPGIKRGANRRKAGDDMTAGSAVLSAGRRLRPEDVGLAASLGLTELAVRTRLRVALFSTGEEVTEPGRPLAPGGIYDANRFSLAAALRGLGCVVTDLGILPDRVDAVRDALDAARRDHDVLMTSGGVSTGEEDHVKAAVDSLGRLDVWRLAIKPGRPVALGRVGEAAFLGLPGNPVAVMVTFLFIARPLLLRLMGATPADPPRFPLPAAFAYKKKPGRREYVRARLGMDEAGRLSAFKHPRDGAGVLSSLVESDGLVELPEDCAGVAPGDTVFYVPLSELR